jgi:hypothetical protein
MARVKRPCAAVDQRRASSSSPNARRCPARTGVECLYWPCGPELRPKVRSLPTSSPSGARGKEPRQTEFDLQGQFSCGRFDGSDPGIAEEGLLSVVPYKGSVNLNPGAAAAAKEVLLLGSYEVNFADSEHVLEQVAVARLRKELGLAPHQGQPATPRNLEYALLFFEEEIANEVLAAHVSGYSTTSHDLIHDLIP